MLEKNNKNISVSSICSGILKGFSKRRKWHNIIKKIEKNLLDFKNIHFVNIVDKVKCIPEKVKTAVKFVKINKKYFITSASVIALAIAFNAFFSFGYSVMIDEKEIAVVESRADFDAAVEDIDSKYSDYLSGSVLDTEAVLLLKIVPNSKISTDEQLENGIKSVSDQMTECYSLKIDGEIVAGFNKAGEAEKAVEMFTGKFITDEQLAGGEYTYSYLNDIEYGKDYVPSALLMDAYAACMMLDNTEVKYGTYEVKENDSIKSVMDAFGMTKREFKMLNPFVGDDLNGVKLVNIREVLPALMVMTTQKLEYDETIPFKTEKMEDASAYEGSAKIVQEGKEGVTHIVENIERINGIRTSKNIVANNVVEDSVTQLVLVGTKERPAGVGTGTFLRPYYGSISSRYGSRRSGFHTGVDFCGTVGDNIVAADSGTVVFSGWSGGYGNIVKIDHNNGYVTYYAHCNSLVAQVGQKVEKGEVIAKLGNTGNSTGPHVHFEIIKDGQTLNPMDYVG